MISSKRLRLTISAASFSSNTVPHFKQYNASGYSSRLHDKHFLAFQEQAAQASLFPL